MRIVVVGAGGAHKTETSIARGARSLGHDVRHVNVMLGPRDGLLGRAAQHVAAHRIGAFAPDFILVTRPALRLGTERLAELAAGRAAALWYFDFTRPVRDDVAALARALGRLWLTCPTQADEYRAAGVPAVQHVAQGLDPVADRPATRVPAEFRCDVSFIGSGQYVERHELLRRIGAVARLQVRGPYWEGLADSGGPGSPSAPAGGAVRGRRFAQAVAGAAINLGAGATAAQDCEPHCMSNRIWKVLGCGGFYLGAWVPGADDYARNAEHCVWYRSADEAVALVQRWLPDAEGRARIARAGRRHALAHHTYAHRLRAALEEAMPGAHTSR